LFFGFFFSLGFAELEVAELEEPSLELVVLEAEGASSPEKPITAQITRAITTSRATTVARMRRRLVKGRAELIVNKFIHNPRSSVR